MHCQPGHRSVSHSAIGALTRYAAAAGLLLCLPHAKLMPAHGTPVPAFPGAVGQGSTATGGRGGDVYHVTNLQDYDPRHGQAKVPGSFRHALRSAAGPRTIVFDVGGAIALAGPLEILKDNLTIAGQTSPGSITLWGYPVEISGAKNIILRYLRFRPGDFHARRPGSAEKLAPGEPLIDPSKINGLDVGGGSDRVILDHLSVSWAIDETLSVTNARNITVQNCLIAESLNNSYHPKGPHGYGSLVRGALTAEDQQAGVGGYTFYRNLWAHHRARNPSLGGEQFLRSNLPEERRLRTDANLVNNVIYGWGDQPTHRSNLGQVRVNLIGNCYVNGPASKSTCLFNEDNPAPTQIYHDGNTQDPDRDEVHNPREPRTEAQLLRAFCRLDKLDSLTGPGGEPFSFLGEIGRCVLAADEAYHRVLKTVGASRIRDSIDERIVLSVAERTGNLINSQEEFRRADGVLPGIDDLPTQERPQQFDSDRDGMPDAFEVSHDLDPTDPTDRNRVDDNGYTLLEVYLNCLVPEQEHP
jgi:hypothetical protein